MSLEMFASIIGSVGGREPIFPRLQPDGFKRSVRSFAVEDLEQAFWILRMLRTVVTPRV